MSEVGEVGGLSSGETRGMNDTLRSSDTPDRNARELPMLAARRGLTEMENHQCMQCGGGVPVLESTYRSTSQRGSSEPCLHVHWQS